MDRMPPSKMGWCRLNPVEAHSDWDWFQLLQLRFDKVLSIPTCASSPAAKILGTPYRIQWRKSYDTQ